MPQETSHKVKVPTPPRNMRSVDFADERVRKELLNNVLVFVGRHGGYKDEFSYDIKFILEYLWTKLCIFLKCLQASASGYWLIHVDSRQRHRQCFLLDSVYSWRSRWIDPCWPFLVAFQAMPLVWGRIPKQRFYRSCWVHRILCCAVMVIIWWWWWWWWWWWS